MEIGIIFLIIFLISVILFTIILLARLTAERRPYYDTDLEKESERLRKTKNLVHSYLNSYNENVNLYNNYQDCNDKLLKELAVKYMENANEFARRYNKVIEEYSSLCNGKLPRGLPKFLPLIVNANK